MSRFVSLSPPSPDRQRAELFRRILRVLGIEDPRSAGRRPCDREAQCWLVALKQKPPRLATVLDVSEGGARLLVGQAIPTGLFLAFRFVELGDGNPASRVIRIVHSVRQPSGLFSVGGPFVRARRDSPGPRLQAAAVLCSKGSKQEKLS
jgi:hypothetical protein